jgi:hypothetical protein
MASLRTIADLDPPTWMSEGLAEAARQVRSMPTRLWRLAVGALCVFAFSALSSVEALA